MIRNSYFIKIQSRYLPSNFKLKCKLIQDQTNSIFRTQVSSETHICRRNALSDQNALRWSQLYCNQWLCKRKREAQIFDCTLSAQPPLTHEDSCTDALAQLSHTLFTFVAVTIYLHIYPNYSDRKSCANSVDPDQTPRYTVCHSSSSVCLQTQP